MEKVMSLDVMALALLTSDHLQNKIRIAMQLYQNEVILLEWLRNDQLDGIIPR